MRIEFPQPTPELIALLATLEEFMIGELIVTDAIHVEAVSTRAQNIVTLLRDPIYRHNKPAPDRFSAITDLVQTDGVQP